ncbi:MAG: tetratricopeptide repeat protein [Anaerolineae bacterium]
MTYRETYESVRATPELVGREKEVLQINQAILDTANAYVIYITGPGGIGKTRLVQHVLEHVPQLEIKPLVASDIIDLYHTSARTAAGLMERIQAVLPTEFERYQEKRRELRERYTRGEPIPSAERQALQKAFFADLKNLTDQQRVVLVLDTVEKLFQQEDLAAADLHITEEQPDVLKWLLNTFLPQVQNVVLILSGRPYQPDLATTLKARLSERQEILPLKLSGLKEKAARAYFDAVIAAAQDSDNPHDRRTAEAIQHLGQERRRAIFHCLHDGGDPPTIPPIWLALAIDHLVIDGRPLEAFGSTLDEARQYSTHRREEIRDELGRRLVQALRENRRPGDEVIIALGWLRKGGPPALLARVADLTLEEVEDALEQIRDLSFVKRRPEDDWLFLHDEMYDLLFQHALKDIADKERERVYREIRAYYKQRIQEAREAIAGLYPALEKELPDTLKVAEARAYLEDALVEDLHYRLRWNPSAGFQTYFLYAEEAIATHDENLDMQLRAELLTFVAEQDPSGKQEIIADGLRRADLEADAAIRWVKRYVERQNLDEAWRIVQMLRDGGRDLVADGGVLAEAELNTWEALVRIYRGDSEQNDLERAGDILLTANKQLKEYDVPASQFIRWSALLARNYNNLGYLRRVQGQFIAASEAYQDALPHWRLTKLEAEQANTLTNLAYALALSGEFEVARHQVKDALNLRKKLGTRLPLALTYNTRAAVEVQAGRYREAEPYAARSLEISQTLNFKRGIGLSLLTLSRLHRFLSEDPETPARERPRLLQQSLEEAKEALKHFKDGEPERRMVALYEQGLTHRQLILSEEDHALEHAKAAIQNLEASRKIAIEENLWQKYLDASLGLAWTYYYLQREQPERAAEQEWEDTETFLEILGEETRRNFGDYFLTKERKPEINDDTLIDIFSQLGRLHVLRGVMAMDSFDAGTKEAPYPNLCTAIREFVLAMEYNELVGKEYQGIRRALNTIHRRLKGLNVQEMVAAFNTIRDMAREWATIAEENRLWRELENTFGSYEHYTMLASRQLGNVSLT